MNAVTTTNKNQCVDVINAGDANDIQMMPRTWKFRQEKKYEYKKTKELCAFLNSNGKFSDLFYSVWYKEDMNLRYYLTVFHANFNT